MALPTTQQQEDIAGLYAAFWNRAPDREGFGYWVDLYANGLPLNTIATEFRFSDEGKNAYPLYQTADEFVAQVYQNVFDRAPDAAGQAYWEGILAQPGMTESKLVVAMCNSAQALENDDGALYDNKIAMGIWVATEYLQGNATQDQIQTVTTNAFRYLTSDASSLDAAITYVSHLPVGTPYNLTVNQDVFYGVAGNDLFQSTLVGGQNTLTIGDRLYGGDGWDTLDATLSSTVGAGTFTLSTVEQVNISVATAAADVGVVNGLSGVEVLQFEDTTGHSLNVSGLVGYVDVSEYNISGGDLTVDLGDTAAAQVLTLDTVTNSTVQIDYASGVAGNPVSLEIGVNGGAVSGLTVAGDVLAATTLDITANASLSLATHGITMSGMKNLYIDGSAQVDLSNADLATSTTTLITVDATSATGTVIVDLDNLGAASLSAHFGIGNDTFDISANTAAAGAATMVVDMGAGDDTLVVDYTLPGQTKVTLVGGLGDDTLEVVGIATSGELNNLDFTYGVVSGFSTLQIDGNYALGTADSVLTVATGFDEVVFNDIAFGSDGYSYLEIDGLAANSTLTMGNIASIPIGDGGSTAEFDLVVDAAGSLTFGVNGSWAIVAGTEANNDWAFTNATSLVFDFAHTTTSADAVTLDFGANSISGEASFYADNVTSIVVADGSSGSAFTLDLSDLNTAASNLSSLDVIDFSTYAGTETVNLNTAGVIDSGLLIKLNDGFAAANSNTTIGTFEADTDISETFQFAADLDGKMVIHNFYDTHGAANGDKIDLSLLGITSFSQLTILPTGATSTYYITSSLIEGGGRIEVQTSNGALQASDFIFA